MSGVWLDLKHGLRMLFRNPGFAAAAVATLALGIGANTAIFSVVRKVLLEPLPYHEPERLVGIWENDRLRRTARERASIPDFLDFRAQARSFEQLAGWQSTNRTLTGQTEPERVVVARVSPNWFGLLGVRPVIGRDFVAREETPGQDRVALLGEGMWRRRFGADPSAIGRAITLDGELYTVAGVVPDRARLPFDTTDIWTPLAPAGPDLFRGIHNTRVYARLRPGVTTQSAQAEMTAIMAGLEQTYREDNEGRGAVVLRLADVAVEDSRPALQALQAAALLVLLIGCANVSGLLLARASARRVEMALREWLGASRRQLGRQMLAENLPVALAGGVLGVVLAFWGVDLLRAAGARVIPGMETAAVDRSVLGFAAVITLSAWVLASLAPVLRAGAGRGEVLSRARTGRGLVAVEAAIAVVLLIGSGLLVRSFLRVLAVDPGFDPKGLVAMSVELPRGRYRPPDKWPYLVWPQVTDFQTRLLDRVRTLPGVEAATLGVYTPLGAGWTTRFTVAGRPEPPPGQQEEAQFRPVTEDYFRTARIPVRQGRVFEPRDDAQHPPVAVVNESFVRRHLAGVAAPGQRINVYGVEREIVGVAGDERSLGLERDSPPAMYLPCRQNPLPGMILMVRAAGDPLSLAPSLEREIRALDAELAVFDVTSLERALDATLAPRRFTMALAAVFAAAALLLAAVGVAGTAAYAISRRTREIGVRMALGATALSVERLVVCESLRVVLIGAAAGVAAAAALGRWLESQLFGVSGADPLTFVVAPALLAGAAAAASWLVGRRAARIDPVTALRSE